MLMLPQLAKVLQYLFFIHQITRALKTDEGKLMMSTNLCHVHIALNIDIWSAAQGPCEYKIIHLVVRYRQICVKNFQIALKFYNTVAGGACHISQQYNLNY